MGKLYFDKLIGRKDSLQSLPAYRQLNIGQNFVEMASCAGILSPLKPRVLAETLGY
jgi:hypothetical protein